MELEPSRCYRALQTRDARFDGRFFCCVRTTGVYCRPICPARTPRFENCLFLPCAAAAQAAGFRPCRRCRPETSPGTPAWVGTSATVSRGLRLIAEGALDRGSISDLAARLGIGERHLRRLFIDHLGAAPIAIAQTRRTHFAAKLIEETDLAMSDAAFAAGFSSVRRFNDAVRRTFGKSPSELRNRRGAARARDSELAIRLPYRPPYPWREIEGYLAARATPEVETIESGRVRRALRLDGGTVGVEVSPVEGRHELAVQLRGADPSQLLAVAERVRAVFDLGADPCEIRHQLSRDRRLRGRLRALPGVRVAGAWDPFELAVRVVLGQQVTVAGATRLAGRVAQRFGDPLPDALVGQEPGAPTLLFPLPERLADADLETVGLPGQRAGAIRALARAVADGSLQLDGGADPDRAREILLSLPGIGAWTAELVLLRALRQPDAFPAGDLGLRRALDLDAADLERVAESWRPWRGYAAMLLWSASSSAVAG